MAAYEPCVIRQRINACLCKQGSNFFNTFARLTVDDAGFTFMLTFSSQRSNWVLASFFSTMV
jgi:hypothetical protein